MSSSADPLQFCRLWFWKVRAAFYLTDPLLINRLETVKKWIGRRWGGNSHIMHVIYSTDGTQPWTLPFKSLWLARSWIITAVIIMFLESYMFGISSSNRNRWSV